MSGTNVILKMQEDTLIVQVYQDVEDIIENNKRLAREPQKSDFGRHIWSIPANILNQWLQEEWSRGNVDLKLFDDEFNKLVDKKVRDHDWLFLRTDK